MQVAVEALKGLERKVTVTVPAQQVDEEVTARLKKRAKTAKLKGFRPGKAPLQVIANQFGDIVRSEVINDLIRSSFYEAIKQEQLTPAGTPHFNPKHMEAGVPLEYEAVFEIYPEIKLKDLQGIKIQKLKADITDQDLDKILEKLREQHVEWIEVSRPAQLQDRVMIDFEGFMDGKVFQGGSAKNVAVNLGAKNMIPGFEEGLLGAKPNADLELNLEFPQQYHENLAGKPVKFVIKVHQVLEPKLPTIDDDFAKKLDIKGGVSELRSEVRKSMERELERGIKENAKRQVIEKLVEINPVEVPAALIDAEIEQMQRQTKQRISMQTGNKEIPDLPKEYFTAQAKQRVIVGLLLTEYINQQNLQVDKERVQAMIEEIAASYDHPEQVISYYSKHKQQLAQLQSMVLEEQAIEKLMENAQIEEKNVSYDEVVNPQTNKGE